MQTFSRNPEHHHVQLSIFIPLAFALTLYFEFDLNYYVEPIGYCLVLMIIADRPSEIQDLLQVLPATIVDG